jgi:hypothetical protein
MKILYTNQSFKLNAIFFFIIFLFNISENYAQNDGIVLDSAIYQRGGRLILNGITYEKASLITKILLQKRDNREIVNFANSYKSGNDIAKVLSFVGGFGMGWPIGGLLSKKDFDVGLFAGGAVITVVALIVNGNANNNLKKAIDSYNNFKTANKISFTPRIFQNECNQMNIGLMVNF